MLQFLAVRLQVFTNFTESEQLREPHDCTAGARCHQRAMKFWEETCV